MAVCPVAVDVLIADLRKLQNWLAESLGVVADGADNRETPDPFSPPDDLNYLKTAIDRIRPLLWLHQTRQHELRAANLRKQSSNARSFIDDALTISERHIQKSE